MRFDIVTIFPKMFDAIKNFGISSRAYQKNLVRINTWNPRDYTEKKNRVIDERPYGGGPGMVMLAQPLENTLNAIVKNQQIDILNRKKTGPVIFLTPTGRIFNQQLAKEIYNFSVVTLLCGRYTAIDQRLIENYVNYEVSIGDFILSGGEIAAMIIIDSIIRFIPNALGNSQSIKKDSFSSGLLDCFYYTRPKIYNEKAVPSVLLEGHHSEIKRYRREESLRLTYKKRADLIDRARFNGLLKQEDEDYLSTFEKREEEKNNESY